MSKTRYILMAPGNNPKQLEDLKARFAAWVNSDSQVCVIGDGVTVAVVPGDAMPRPTGRYVPVDEVREALKVAFPAMVEGVDYVLERRGEGVETVFTHGLPRTPPPAVADPEADEPTVVG